MIIKAQLLHFSKLAPDVILQKVQITKCNLLQEVKGFAKGQKVHE